MSRKNLLTGLTVANPCTESWDAMQGDARSRHCAHCDRDVHNLATMSPRAIEGLVRQNNGKLCARITRRRDGSLVTLDGHLERNGMRSSLAANVFASASLALASAGAFAQSSSEQPFAVISGTILKPDGSGPDSHAVISLRSAAATTVEARTDEQGGFQIAVPPGPYDVAVQSGTSQTVFRAMPLQAGELYMGTISASSTTVRVSVSDSETYTNSGVLASIHYSLMDIFRHPVAYAKHIMRRD